MPPLATDQALRSAGARRERQAIRPRVVARWILAFAGMTGADAVELPHALATNRGSSAPVAFAVTFSEDLNTIGCEYCTNGIT
jgi:hypothetical protein